MDTKLLVLIIVLLGAGLYFGIKQLAVTGFTTISLSKATFTSTLPGLACKTGWILTVTEDGLGQTAYGRISAEDIGKQSGTRPQYDLVIEKTNSEYYWKYPILLDTTKSPIIDYQLVEWTCAWASKDDANKNCGAGQWIAYGKYSYSFTCFCVKQVFKAHPGKLENPYLYFTSYWKVSAKDKTYTGTLSSDSQQAKLGDYVFMIWNGNLVKGSAPSQAGYMPIYYNGNWRIGSESKYNEYISYVTDLKGYLVDRNCWLAMGGCEVNRDILTGKIKNVNDAVNSLLTTTYYFGDIINVGSIDNAYVKMSITQGSPPQNPVYTLYVCADLLEIYQPKPIPHIVQATGTQIKTGSIGYITVVVKNSGDKGNIEYGAICNPPVTTLEPSKFEAFDAGETKTLYIKVTGSSSQVTTSTCTVFVRALDVEDRTNVQVTVDPLQVCKPGQRICDTGNVIKECNSAGSGWYIVQQCGINQYCAYENGMPVCKAENQPIPKPGEECAWWDIGCKLSKFFEGINKIGKGLSDFFLMLSIILAGIGGLIILALGRDYLIRDRKDYLGIGITIALAIFVAMLIYYTWWIFILIVIGYYLARLLLPKLRK